MSGFISTMFVVLLLLCQFALRNEVDAFPIRP
jgi:hypothetical protein